MRHFIPIIFLFTFTASSIAAPHSTKEARKDLSAPPSIMETIKKNASTSSQRAEDEQKKTMRDIEKAQTDSATPPDPDVKIIKKADAVIEEYSYNGLLYMVKVTPTIGKPYYLYDQDGNGSMIRQNETPSQITPPRWTLFSW